MLVRDFSLLFGFYGAGRLGHYLGIPLPSNVLGLTILLFALHQRWIALDWISRGATYLLGLLPLMFVPVLVGALSKFPEWSTHGLSILLAMGVSMSLAMVVTGWWVQVSEQRSRRKVRNPLPLNGPQPDRNPPVSRHA